MNSYLFHLEKMLLYVRLALLSSVAVAVGFAQSGFVRSSGQPIPGATITITQGAQTFSTVTDGDGHYTFPPLSSGSWNASIDMFGFETLTQPVVFSSEQPFNFELKLKESQLLARLRQRQAGSNSPGSNPGNAQGRGQNTNQQFDQQLQNELNAQQSASQSSSNAVSTGSNESFLVSGSLSPGMAEGAMADSGPEPRFGPGGMDASSQNLAGSPFGQPSGGAGTSPGGGFGGPGGGPGGGAPGGFGGPGGFGRNGGPGRGGSPGPRGAFGNYRRRNQQIHGQASFTIQNSALNAKPFSINGLDIPQAAYAQTRFSLIVGGPLMIPKIVKDPSTQFFLTYFGTRAKTPSLFSETVPTAGERAGDFSQATQSLGTSATSVPVTIYDPSTNRPFANNVIPTRDLNPIALALLRYYPAANQPGSANNYQYETAAPSNTDNLGFRIQRNVTQKDRVSANIQYQHRDSATPQAFGYQDPTSGYGLSLRLGYTRNFTATIVNTFQVTFSRNRTNVTPYFSTLSNVAAELGIAGTSSNSLNFGPPTLNFTNFASLTDSSPSLVRAQSQGFTDSLTYVRGLHNFTFGGGYTRPDRAVFSSPNGRGTFNFTGIATSEVNSSGQVVTGTGYDLADFLLGLPQSSSIQYNGQSDYFLSNQFNLYAQDDWKIASNFTATLGVRYDFFSPVHEKYGRMANLDIASDYTAVAPVEANGVGPYSGSFPSGLIDRDWNNFSPRIAIAWKLKNFKRSTVIRSGYGIYYNSQAYLSFATQLADQPPFAVSNNVNTSAANVLTLSEGFLTTAAREISNTFAVQRNYRTPYAGTWDFFIQRDLGGGFFIDLGYLGTKGTGLDVRTLPNEGPSGSSISTAQRTQLGDAVGFTLDQSVGNSIFNALQVRANRRFNHGLSFQAFYQFAKSIDDSSTFGGVSASTVAQNWLDISAERGLSSFDVRHEFTLGFVWTSPVGGPGSHMSGDTWTGRLLKDWQISGNLTAQTGNPLTARVLGNTQQLAQTSGVGSGRAEATGAAISGAGQFFNLDAFTVPVTGTYGNAGRNTIPGPGLISLNTAFGRSFNISERRRIEFRIEGNNVFNHVNYTNVYTVVNALDYGLPETASTMRTLDAVVRLRF